jgi:cell cycle sensor histidine kinase DivJ
MLAFAQSQNLLPAPLSPSLGLTTLVVLSAALYAAALAFGAQILARATAATLRAKDDRYQLLASQMTDVVARHGRNGAILFVSPAAASMFRAPVGDLLGGGLLARVHAADRPAYLAALADASEFGHERLVELRILRETNAAQLAEIVWIEMRCRKLDRVAHPQRRPEVVAIMRDITLQKEQAAIIESLRAVVDEATAAGNVLLSFVSREQLQKNQPVAVRTDARVKSSA